ncbi:putative tRNA (guanine(26)-N(2))-dimethyltransferase [Blattella germanica]|nr:putative tRNA (guanine(26)-N(2))-dimethyltransferase [Blattella germanica]
MHYCRSLGSFRFWWSVSCLSLRNFFRLNVTMNQQESEPTAQVIKEGKAEIRLPPGKNVFYNPVQEFNRDLSIAVLTLCAEDLQKQLKEKRGEGDLQLEPSVPGKKYEEGLTILEALSASGLRSIRYAKEVPGVKEIVANDISEQAVESIRQNVAQNGVDHLVSTSHDDAVMVMYKHRRPADRFTAVDLDPYGCASPFLDAAVQCVSDGGVLLVTCTDMAVLAGNCPESCYSKYGAISLRVSCCHEMGKFYIFPFLVHCLSLRASHFESDSWIHNVTCRFRRFLDLTTHTLASGKLAMVYQCVGCKTITLQPLGVENKYGDKPHQFKFSLPQGPPVDSTCTHCGHRHHIGGPIWNGPLHDQTFVYRLQELAPARDFGTMRRMQGVLAVVGEELPDVPLPIISTLLVASVKMSTRGMRLRSLTWSEKRKIIKDAEEHSNPTSVRKFDTDAAPSVVWDILRHWVKKHPLRQDRMSGVAAKIISQEPTNAINMELRADANPESRERGLVRFQENPKRFWGPGSRSKSNVLGEKAMEKSKRNQGKRTRNELSPVSESGTKHMKDT